MRRSVLCVISVLMLMLLAGCSAFTEALGGAEGSQGSMSFSYKVKKQAESFGEHSFISALEDAARSSERAVTLAYKSEDGLKDRISAIADNIYDRYFFGRYVTDFTWSITERGGECTVTVEMGCTGEEIPSEISGPVYTKESLYDRLLSAITAGERSLELIYESENALDEAIKSDISSFITSGSYALCEYYVNNMNYSASLYSDYTSVRADIEYAAGRKPYDEIPSCSTPLDAVYAVKKAWEAGESSAVFLLKGELSSIPAISGAADANSAYLACVCDSYNYVTYGRSDAIIELVRTDIPERGVIMAKSAELAAAVSEFTQGIDGETQKEQLRGIYDGLKKLVTYDLSVAGEDNQTADTVALRSAYGALVKGFTVCSGYARAFKAACDELGLDCWVIKGAQEGVPHEWNMVRLDGETLYIDATFGDTGGGGKYFLFPEDELSDLGYAIDDGYIMPF